MPFLKNDQFHTEIFSTRTQDGHMPQRTINILSNLRKIRKSTFRVPTLRLSRMHSTLRYEDSPFRQPQQYSTI